MAINEWREITHGVYCRQKWLNLFLSKHDSAKQTVAIWGMNYHSSIVLYTVGESNIQNSELRQGTLLVSVEALLKAEKCHP